MIMMIITIIIHFLYANIYTYIPETNHVSREYSAAAMVPVAPVITGITFVFTFHVLYFYCKVFILLLLLLS
jgi:hypothetical protein